MEDARLVLGVLDHSWVSRKIGAHERHAAERQLDLRRFDY